MCTAITKKGNDLIFGYNLDLDPAEWQYRLCRRPDYFAVGITVGKTTYLTHGVNRQGNFSDLPYLNGESFSVPRAARRERIDLMTDRYIRGKYCYSDIETILQAKILVPAPAATMHSLLGSGQGDLWILEPGYGCKRVEDDYAVLTNFPVLMPPDDLKCPFFGKDRYDKAVSLLRQSGDDFSAADALELLRQVRQEGRWGTRLSFAYSRNENAVYYTENGDFSRISVHRFL